MKKHNKTIALILTVLMLASIFAAAACASGNNGDQQADGTDGGETTEAPADATPAPTDEPEPNETVAPTDEPSATDEPTATDEPEPQFPEEYFYANLDPNVPCICDIDFDGLDDTVMLAAEEQDYDVYYSLVITLGVNPNNTISLDYDYPCYDCTAFITDSDRFDSRLDIIASFEFDSDDHGTCLYRVDKDGTGIDYFEVYASVLAIDYDARIYALDGQFYLGCRTEILGTSTVSMLCEAREDGFEYVSDCYYYGDYKPPVEVISEITVRLVDINDEIVGERTLTPGEKVTALYTDTMTYVMVQLEDGSLARIDIEIVDDWHPYIDGEPQENYFDIVYAD